MFTRVHHVAIAVRGLDQSLGMYRDILGLPVGKRAAVADQGVHAALLPMADGEIELLEPADPAGGVARFLERRGEGLHHLCFETPDVAAALTQAKTAGLPLIDQAPRPGLAGMIAFLHPKGNHGVLIEMAQPVAPSSHPVSAAGIQADSVCTVYLATRDLAAAAATYARNFQGTISPVQDAAHFGARRITVSIGTGRVTLLSPAEAASPVGTFLADRGEGLYGVCLGVRDFARALRRLANAGIPVQTRRPETADPLAQLVPDWTNGVNLFLCPSGSATMSTGGTD